MIQNRCQPSFCTSNIDIIKLLIVFAKYNNLPVLLETTSNQINQYGGYTYLNPKQFCNKINTLANKLKYKKKIIFGADHLGPLPWKKYRKNIALKNSKILFKEVIKAGYKKIHIDTGMKLKNEKFLSKEKIFKRCKLIFESVNKKKIKNIFFVFGTEVPIAGGERSYILKNTSIKSILADLEYYKNLKNTFSLVIEPGLGFTNQKVHKLKMNNFLKKKKLSELYNFSYEAHSSDYQDLRSLKKLVKNNFRFLKVGPELTFYYTRAVLKMEILEKLKFKNNLSNIRNNISKEMDFDKTFWKDYYFGNKMKIEHLKFNSYLDRSRYYLNKSKVLDSLKILKKNINSIDIKLLIKNNKNIKTKLKLKKKLNLNNFDFLVFESLIGSFTKFYKSCDYGLKNI